MHATGAAAWGDNRREMRRARTRFEPGTWREAGEPDSGIIVGENFSVVGQPISLWMKVGAVRGAYLKVSYLCVLQARIQIGRKAECAVYVSLAAAANAFIWMGMDNFG